MNGGIRVRTCCEKVWLACVLDSEGSVQVWEQASINMPTRAHGIRVMLYNTDEAYVSECLRILSKWGVEPRVTRRRTSKVGKKIVAEMHIQVLNDVITVLENIIPHLFVKKNFAIAALGLAISRKTSRGLQGIHAPWTDDQVRLAQQIRKTYMPYRKRANGETLATKLQAIPCQAEGSADSTSEGVETRQANSTSSNLAHECPASLVDEDIVQSSKKFEQGDKEPLNGTND